MRDGLTAAILSAQPGREIEYIESGLSLWRHQLSRLQRKYESLTCHQIKSSCVVFSLNLPW